MAKWFVVLTFLNVGLALACFGAMAKQESCSEHLINTFLHGGYFMLGMAAFALFVSLASTLAAWLIERQHRRDHRSRAVTSP